MKMGNKIKKIIDLVPRDKLLHILAGIIIALLVLKVMSFLPTMPMIARIVSFAAVIVAGVIREVYNKKNGGIFDKYDLYATIFGGLIVELLTTY